MEIGQHFGRSRGRWAAISIVHHVGRLQRPLFVAHGREDKRVPIKQFDDLVAAARKADVVLDTLTLDDTHNLEDAEQETLLLTRMLAFLARHNPAY